jgi:hypothetical protein
MKINRRQMRTIIRESLENLGMNHEDVYDADSDYYESRREEDFEAMRASAEDALERIIGAGISSEVLIGSIRRDPELRSYRFEEVMSMIDDLESKDRISGFLGNQSEF